MMWVWILVWAISIIVSYIMMRICSKINKDIWTHGDLVWTLILSILIGPLMAISSIAVAVGFLYARWDSSNMFPKFRKWWNKKSRI